MKNLCFALVVSLLVSCSTTETPFEKAMECLTTILPTTMSVDTIEQTVQSTGKVLDDFNEKQRSEKPPKLDEKSIVVFSADGKGVPIRHHNDTDGYCSGFALERAIIPLIQKQHSAPKAAWEKLIGNSM